MIQHTPEQLFAFWGKATPSRLAPIAFLPSQHFPQGTTRADFKTSKASVGGILGNLQAQAERGEAGDFLGALQKSISETVSLDDERNRLVDLGKRELLKAMAAGDIRAFAFEAPRKRADCPVELMADDFSGSAHFRWDTGELRSQGLHFLETRFISVKRIDDLLLKEMEAMGNRSLLSEPGPKKQPGRPTMRPHIEAAFRALLADGQIDFTASKIHHFPLVRHWINDNYPDFGVSDAFPNNETIRRYFGPLFDKAKKQ